ncbi:hypothetical protein [Falsibacillus pallidus]|uniref:PapR protein n=1 Tax=Falsibacillus pallidus TaxID=493781 RepID=A0A370GAC1_9BACI|nr:hypothetical protein [Falsibacillus pallidus]RDI40150.1 hypothetical protein DFR59_11266 [Falsibacillus pallidus]
MKKTLFAIIAASLLVFGAGATLNVSKQENAELPPLFSQTQELPPLF